MKDYSELERLAEAATPGPWDTDFTPDYDGTGKFMCYSIGCGPPDKWKVIVSTRDSDLVEVHEDHDVDRSTRWDERGKRNAAFIAAANPQAILALIARVKELEHENTDLKQSVIAFAGPHAAEWATLNGTPGHLHPQHYDLLSKCGARMDDFTRLALSGKGA